MEFYQLEEFIAVVEERSFTRAAERVFRTQAAVSVAIKRLEDELGVPLLTRSGHECVPTEAGRALLGYARRLTTLRDESRRCVAEFTSLGTGSISLAAHESAAQYLLPAPLSVFHQRHPKIKIVSRLCEVEGIAQLVAEREVDLGFGIHQKNLGALGLSSELIVTDPQVLVGAPGCDLIGRESVRIADLSKERFFVHHLHTLTTDAIERLFASEGGRFEVVAELWSFETIKEFVRAGSGMAIVPLSVVQVDLATGRLTRIPVQNLTITRAIEAIYREKDQLPPAPVELLGILRKWKWAEGFITRQGLPSKRGD